MANVVVNDINRLLDYLPEELWISILMRIFDPDDLLAIFQSSGGFRVLVESQKWRFRFFQVVPFIIPYLDEATTHRTRRVCIHWAAAISRTLSLVSGTSSLGFACRMFTPRPIYEALRGQRCTPAFRLGTGSGSLSEFKERVNGTSPRVRSSMILYSVFLADQCPSLISREKARKFWRSIIKVFRRHGHLVRNLLITFKHDGTWCTQVISALLQHTPNLRYLDIGGEIVLRDKQMSEERFLLVRPLSFLSLRVSLQGIPGWLISSLIEQLQPRYYASDLPFSFLNWHSIQTVEELTMEEQSLNDALLQQIRLFPCTITRLCVGFRTREYFTMNIYSVLNAVGNHLVNLEKLRLGVTYIEDSASFCAAFLRPFFRWPIPDSIVTPVFRRVTELSIITSPTHDHTYLLQFPRLQKLYLFSDIMQNTFRGYRDTRVIEGYEVIRINRHIHYPDANGIFESNIWRRLPELNYFNYTEYISAQPDDPREIFRNYRWQYDAFIAESMIGN